MHRSALASRMLPALFVITAAAVPALAESAGPPAEVPLVGRWLAENIGGGGVIDDAQTTLEIAEGGALSGSGGCNRYTARAAISGNGLTVSPVAAAQMACVPALMEQERRFFSALTSASSFEIDVARGTLTLIDAMGHPKATLSRMD